MEIKASAKYIRMSPRKVRLVVDVIRGLTVPKALDQLKFTSKWAVKPIGKLLNSAIANAEHDFEIEQDNLYIKEIRVDGGPTLKRWMPRAHGRATPIRKRTSHISIVLSEIEESGKVGPKKQKVEAPVKLDSKPKEDDGVRVKSKKADMKKGNKEKDEQDEKDAKIIDPRGEGKGKHTKVEGKSHKGFSSRFFRRKSG